MSFPETRASRLGSREAYDCSPVWGYALIAAGLVYRLAVALRPLKWLDGLTLPDDAYLSLTIARNIGRGLGPLYGTSYTNGFQPLWVLLMAPVYAWRPFDLDGNVHAALVFLAAWDTVLAMVVCLLMWRWTRSPLATAVVAAAWALNPYSVRTSLCGLEASVSAALAALVLLLLDRARGALGTGRRHLVVLGFALGFAILARIDNGFLALTVAPFLFPRPVPSLSRALRAGLARILPVAAASAAVVVPWLVYSWRYTGDLYPISGRAVRLVAVGDRIVKGGSPEGFRRDLLGEAWAWFQQDNGLLLWLVAGLLLVAVVFLRSDLASLGPALSHAAPSVLLGAMLFFVYPLHVLAHWFFPRYQYPILIPLLLVLGLLLDFVATRIGRLAVPLAASLALGCLVFHASRHETRVLLSSKRENVEGYRAIGLWANGAFPGGTTIGSSQTGALGYFAPDLRVVNLDGVVNRACYDSLVARRNIDYILDEKIEFVLGWPNNIGFIRLFSKSPADPFLVPLGPVPGITSWGNKWLLYRVRREAPGPAIRGPG